MATVSFDVYHADDEEAPERTNNYLVDGHGAAVGRTNRYILSHSPDTPHAAHNCPDDALTATEYMRLLRANYERLHKDSPFINNDPESGGKRDITHVQFYVSWAEHEDVPADEALAMTQELIDRTALKNFACFCAYHDNTWRPELQDLSMEPTEADGSGNKHTHLSVCPYSLDGTHKLLINNATRYDIWREANHICYEHGYSIVNHPKLLAQPEYRAWFEGVVREGKIKIHPYRNKKGKHTRQEQTASEKHNAKTKEKERVETIKGRVAAKDPSVHDHFDGVRVTQYNPKTGEAMSPISQECLALYSLAYRAQRRSAISKNLRTFDAWLKTLDIQTREELYEHQIHVNMDIAKLNREIARQTSILGNLAPIVARIEEWEGKRTSEAYHALKSASSASDEQMASVKKKYDRAEKRLAKYEQLLAERKAEAERLAAAETTLRHAEQYIRMEEDRLKQDISAEEKKKYIEWILERRRRNSQKAAEAIVRSESLLAKEIRARGERYDKSEFRDLRYLIRQTAYLDSALQTELDKLDRLLDRWMAYNSPTLPEPEREKHGDYVRWCGCDPDEPLGLEALRAEREIIVTQQEAARTMHDALMAEADKWKGRNNLTHAENNLAWIKQRELQLRHQLDRTKASRKELWEIAKNCEKAAKRYDDELRQAFGDDAIPILYGNEYWVKYNSVMYSLANQVKKQKDIEAQLKVLKAKKKAAKDNLREADKADKKAKRSDMGR